MAKRIISLKMEDELIEKLDEVAKLNHRKRGPEINVAVEFYLKYQGVDLDKLKLDILSKGINESQDELVEDEPEEQAPVVECGEWGSN